ncbi:MAG: hypothetical protein ACOC9B_02045 [Chloroflexota bacterium]
MLSGRDSTNSLCVLVLLLMVVMVAGLVVGLLLLWQQVAEGRAVLAYTEERATHAESDLEITRSRLAATEDDLIAAEHELDRAEEQIEALDSAVANCEANTERMVEGYGYVLTDPTYDMVVDFLAADGTDSKTYDTYHYNCTDYSADVKANAARAGIRCAYVNIYFPELMGHSIVAFDTTDEGLIFIEPQSDAEVDLAVGDRYHESVRPEPRRFYSQPDYDDTVLRFNLVW